MVRAVRQGEQGIKIKSGEYAIRDRKEDGDLFRLENRRQASRSQSLLASAARCAPTRSRKGMCPMRPQRTYPPQLQLEPRPAPAPMAKITKGANSLEEQIEFASLDLCALEPSPADDDDDDEDEWTDWNQDPWLLGADPWTARVQGSPRTLDSRWQEPPRKPLLVSSQMRIVRKSRSVRASGRPVGQQYFEYSPHLLYLLPRMLLGHRGKTNILNSRLPEHPAQIWMPAFRLQGHPAKAILLKPRLP